MTTLKFKCKLLSDVILNVKSASEGPNKTLDFIPGNCFLGIVAKEYSNMDNETAWEIFHSGKVRFGDAHPLRDGYRTLRVPASMYYPKLGSAQEKCYIRHFYSQERDKEEHQGTAQQLKQCRNGFYAFSDGEGKPSESPLSYAIKSAYDREQRRTKDEAMYGYESLRKGAIFCFSVEIENKKLVDTISKSILGKQRIGRSRTAQYGLVEITFEDYLQTESQPTTGKYTTVYADSRLIFLDENGSPTFQPDASTFQPDARSLGLSGGKICWKLSQIRTFQYAPWNSKRQAFDTDRCGIEKGSVFVVENCPDKVFESKYVGSYRNEGFGKVIYNPDFLLAKDGTNGEARYNLLTAESKREAAKEIPIDSKPLLSYVKRQKDAQDSALNIYKRVNEFADKNWSLFKGERFASQWGTIRSIAMNIYGKESLKAALFDEDGYLGHGVAKEKWEEKGRLKAFSDFFDKTAETEIQEAVISLASQMAKKCKPLTD